MCHVWWFSGSLSRNQLSVTYHRDVVKKPLRKHLQVCHLAKPLCYSVLRLLREINFQHKTAGPNISQKSVVGTGAPETAKLERNDQIAGSERKERI